MSNGMSPLLLGGGKANGVALVPEVEVAVLHLLAGGDELVDTPFFAFPLLAFFGAI